jgi:hypothetical protein
MKHRDELLNLLQPLPPAFSRVGLELIKTEQSSSNLAGDTTTFIFINRQTSIQLELSIGEKYESITTWISKKDSSYHLQEYMNFKKRSNEYNQKFFNVGKLKYLDNLCYIIDNELGDIITGNKWEDIPRDWMGYK